MGGEVVSIKTDNLIVDFKSKTQSLLSNSNADPRSKKLVADVVSEIAKLLNDLTKEIEN